ncbi:NAD(P)-dependent oxidoreductase [Pseudogemmobacter bohemicus]|uniref:NAD(P)-dependent oxidoreductase n=1 Tax=Pseudogemmobacter bohemicus TaxID=2250708 RepID=UPI000DD4AC3E|nr:NAD(P)-dependent oxidoreductase [Pseudogemmobacter bohemicus]
MDRQCIAFLGLGLMGSRMARRLIDAGLAPVLWNRSPEKLAPFAGLATELAATAPEAARQADIIILMTDRPETVEALLFGPGRDALIHVLKPGALVIDMSSNNPDFARSCARRLAANGMRFLDAPVSGGTDGAARGTLAIMAGGAAADFAEAEPIFSALGNPVHVGGSGAGQLVKLANQIIVAVTIGAVAEATVLARAGGADPAALRQALAGGFADSRILQLHGGRMVSRDFRPGGSVDNQIKDLDAASGVAAAAGVTLPLLQAVRSAFTDLASQGDGDKDHSALILWLERLNLPLQAAQ